MLQIAASDRPADDSLGLELSFRELAPVRAVALAGATIQIILTIALGLGLGLVMGWGWLPALCAEATADHPVALAEVVRLRLGGA